MREEITHAIVLSAGFGTRMLPLTQAVPKPLVRLAGRTLIDRVLDRLADAGIGRAVVNVHYLADLIEEHLAKRSTPAIAISSERDRILDTGGGVKRALSMLGTGPFIVHNSDSVWEETGTSNLANLIHTWKPGEMGVLLLLAERDSSIGYEGQGDFARDNDGRLRRRALGETVPYVYAGAAVVNPQLFDGILEEAFSLNVIFDRAAALNALYGVVLNGRWIHAGTPQALKKAESHWHDGDWHRSER